MDFKKKRNSILKNPAKAREDGILTETVATPCVKRRISFKGKRSVREFNREEEAKLWNTSYEISDIQSINSNSVSSNGIRSFQVTRSQTQINATESEHMLEDDKAEITNKENMKSKCIFSYNAKNKKDSLHSTNDFINKTMECSSIFVANNSLGFSLLEHEKLLSAVQKRPSVTFLMTDAEAQMIASNRSSNIYRQGAKQNHNQSLSIVDYTENLAAPQIRNLPENMNSFIDMEISTTEYCKENKTKTNLFKNTMNANETMDIEACDGAKMDTTVGCQLGVTMDMSLQNMPLADKKTFRSSPLKDKNDMDGDLKKDTTNVTPFSITSQYTMSLSPDHTIISGYNKLNNNDKEECGTTTNYSVTPINPKTSNEKLNYEDIGKKDNCLDLDMSLDDKSFWDNLQLGAPKILQSKRRPSIYFNEDIIQHDNTLISDNIESEELTINIQGKNEPMNIKLSNEAICVEEEVKVLTSPSTGTKDTMDISLIHCEETNKEQNKLKSRRTVYLNDEIQIDTECTPYTNKNTKPKNGIEKETNHNFQGSQLPWHKNMNIDTKNIEINLKTKQSDRLVGPLKIAKPLFKLDALKTKNDTNERKDEKEIPLDMNQTCDVSMEIEKFTPKKFLGTPHRSLLEFELMERDIELELEKETEIDTEPEAIVMDMQIKNKDKRVTTYKPIPIDFDESGISPIENLYHNVSKKRSTLNLTPCASDAKRQQTLLDNCDLETTPESKSQTLQTSAKNKRKTNLYMVDMNLDDDRNEILGINSFKSIPPLSSQTVIEDEDIDQTLPCRALDVNPLLSMEIADQSDVLEEKKDLSNLEDKENSVIPSPQKFVQSNQLSLVEEIQMPRAIALSYQCNSIVLDHDAKVDVTLAEEKQFDKSKLHSINSEFEGNPITISDVSAHFLAHRPSHIPKPIGRNNRSTIHKSIEKLNLDINMENISPVSSVDHTASEIAKFNKKYIDLTECTVFDEKEFGSSEIEKTRISLIDTLLDDESEVGIQETDVIALDMNDLKEDIDRLRRETNSPDTNSVPKSSEVNTNGNISVCRKCKRCQDTIVNESSSKYLDSIVLPNVDLYKSEAMEQLKLFRKGPRLRDVVEHFENNCQLNMEPNLKDMDRSLLSDEADESAALIFENLKENVKIAMEIRTEYESDAYETTPFVERLESNLRNLLPHWIFNYQMEAIGILLFSHAKVPLFDIQVEYEEMDSFGHSMKILNVSSILGLDKKFWKPIDYLIDFQIQIELPIDIFSMCDNRNEEDLIDCLTVINNVTMEVYTLSKNFWNIICREQASLIRDERGVFIKKCVRKIVSRENKYSHVEKIEFLVEVFNMQKVNFKNITKPPLYQFDEQIQELPHGLEFLHEFLGNPTKYLKCQ